MLEIIEPYHGKLFVFDYQELNEFINRNFKTKEKLKMIKILFLSANPTDTSRLRLDEEIRSIDNKLRLSQFRDNFELIQHWAVQVSDIQALLLRHKPHIVQFSGHASASSEILVEDNKGNNYPVPVQALSKLFSILKDDIKCVVLRFRGSPMLGQK